MSNVVGISVEKRENLGSANSRRLRRSGNIPAVLYGHGVAPVSLSIPSGNAEKLSGHTGMVELSVDSAGKHTAILKELQHNPITGKIIHIDFQSVRVDELITVPVRVVSFGEPAGLKKGGQLEQVTREIEIECLPGVVPEVIKVDVSALEMDQAFHVGDLQLAEGLKVLGDSDLILFHVRAPRTTAETGTAEAAAEGQAAATPTEEDSAKKKA